MKFQTIKLEELFEIPTKNGLTRPSRDRGIGFKMVNMGELFANDIIRDIPMELVEMNPTEQKNFNLQNEDLLFARQSIVAEGAGKCSIVDNVKELTTFESHLIRVRLNKKICNPWFYFYYFASPLSPMKSIIMQGVQAGIKASDLKELDIIYPSLEDQNKVSCFFRNIDELIFNNSQSVVRLHQIIESLYREWFINFKFPNHEQVEFFDGIPEAWVKKTIFDCYEVLSGGTPKTTNPLYWENGKIPFFTPKDATDSYFVNETEKYITEDGLSRCNSKLYDEKTIFITARGTVGKTAIPMRPMAMNQSCYALKPKADLCFYYSFLNIEDAINQIKQNANGGVFDAIVVDTFKQIDVLVPDMEIQVKFENLVQPMFEQIKNLLEQNEHLVELKHTLLPRLMSGELDVSKLSSIE